jgi:chromosome segregation ATPase
MLDLKRYGIADKWPKLAKLQQEVASLERERDKAQGEVMATSNAIAAAKAKDTEAASIAVRAGKAIPSPKHEAQARAALEDAQRTWDAYAKAAEGARVDLATTTAKHRGEIRAAVIDALRENDQALAQHAREAARRYAFREDAQYDLKELTPPTPPDENAAAQRNSFELIGQFTTSNTPARGDVEGMLGYLAGLVSQYPEPEPTEPPPSKPKVSMPASGTAAKLAADVGVGTAGAGANDNA